MYQSMNIFCLLTKIKNYFIKNTCIVLYCSLFYLFIYCTSEEKKIKKL